MSRPLPSLRSLPRCDRRKPIRGIDDGLGPKDEFSQSVYDSIESLEFVPTTLCNYGVIAKRIVQKNGLELQFVPLEFPFYTELAVLAVQQNGNALQFVPMHHPAYWMLSKLALVGG